MKTNQKMIDLRKRELDQHTTALRPHIERPQDDTVINFIN